MMKRSKRAAVLGVALVVGSLQAAASQGRPASLTGEALTNVGSLTMAAVTLPNGSSAGHSSLIASVCMPGGDCDAIGPVLQVVAPAGARDFWYITVQRNEPEAVGDLTINWYIRDVGDGATLFDEVSFITDIGVDCSLLPDPVQAFSAVADGDFRAR